MTPVIPSSTSNISLIPGPTFSTKKTISSIKCCNLTRSTRRTLYAQDCVLLLSTSLRLFPHIRTFGLQHKQRFAVASATEVDVAVEQADQSDVPVSEQESGQTSEPTSTVDKSKQRSRPVRKSEMPPVKDEELVPGASFTGKVRSIQPFGAFVDFGAFTDGLVHVSRLSEGYVKDVASVVSVGQEVKVKLVEANIETGRIALTMRESEPASGGDTSRPPRRTGQKSNQRQEGRKSTKFVKGQDLEGTVKNLTRSGAFINLPDGEEGFLPASEEADEGFGSIMGTGSSLEIGQEVKVRVLRIARGQVTLTMKKDEDNNALDSKLQGKVFTATNPFLVAFRQNKDIASFLDDREKAEETTEAEVKLEASVDETEEVKPVSDEEVKPDIVSNESQVIVPVTEENVIEASVSDSISTEEKVEIPEETISSEQVDDDIILENVNEDSDVKIEPVSGENGSITSEEQVEIPEEAPVLDENVIAVDAEIPDAVPVGELIENQLEEPETKVETDAEIAVPVAEEKVEAVEETITKDAEIPDAVPVAEVKDSQPEEPETKAEADTEIVVPVAEEKVEEVAAAVENTTKEAEIPDGVQVSEVIESQPEEPETKAEADTEIEVPVAEEKVEAVSAPVETTTKDAEIPDAIPIGEVIENQPEEPVTKAETDTEIVVPVAEEKVEAVSAPVETATKATISPALVKQLREETGAGMMDCKKALKETEGDLVKAQEYLRKKGLASADKKASRATAEGRIGSYIHDSRIGVLVEVNCETDFVSRGDIFKELVNDLAMQVAACPQVQYLSTEDVPADIIAKEREIEMQKEDLLSKPEQFRSKIVDGRIKKRLDELALLEQAYIKDDKVVVKDFIKSTIATIGENMKVKRFVRFNLGEGLEKRSQDFAAEVAAQTTAKKVSAPTTEPQPAATENVDTANEAPKAAISAALVKQLREETGAGMMDCKKALSETGGDLVKAQEYLRKKGLSTADKKSSRLAAEGRIGSYIHDSRIGVLIEVNCETDFVGRSEKFKELVDDLAMQVVACPKVEYVSIEDIPESIVSKERDIEMQREDILSKPEGIRGKIVDGRVAKRLGELALLEQPFLKDDSVLVKDFVKQTVAAIGENIKVRRFIRFTLGESSETKSEETES
ncbi:polyprotein of EF-Ts, chloroplastic-like isoform X2 [Rutidosis leptorrhynchoides]|uniref:polyprotein of EF-Ts, chloroplastic-like isoform X2 n=1 Tax=Rutidosis leptorrhynchoides TaxID=125765 RepID=UPI003A990C0C